MVCDIPVHKHCVLSIAAGLKVIVVIHDADVSIDRKYLLSLGLKV